MMDHDSLFKELISTFFLEFIELFLPEVSAYNEAGSLEFLDKEFLAEVGWGDRLEADLVAKLRFKSEDTFFLIHVENQDRAQVNFGRRMYSYFARLHERHEKRIRRRVRSWRKWR